MKLSLNVAELPWDTNQMSYMFAVKCKIRRIEFGQDSVSQNYLERLLVVTHVEYPCSTISISDYGPNASLATHDGPGRVSLVGEIIESEQSFQRFLFLFQQPSTLRTRGLFLPACGEAKVGWSAKRPYLEARLLARLSADFIHTREPALWVVEGQHIPWDRELLNPEMIRDFSAES